jgi:hypothetical protein
MDRELRLLHLTPDEVVDAAWSSTAGRQGHLGHCAPCRDEVDAVREVNRTLTRSRTAPTWALVLAASLAVASLPLLSDAPAEPTWRGATGVETVSELRPQGVVTSAPRELAWRAVEAADAYRVTLRGGDGRLVWTSEVQTQPSASLPEAVRARRGTHYWQVEALRGGTRMGLSRPTRLTWGD